MENQMEKKMENAIVIIYIYIGISCVVFGDIMVPNIE